jgi:hypothetical protein
MAPVSSSAASLRKVELNTLFDAPEAYLCTLYGAVDFLTVQRPVWKGGGEAGAG